VVAGIGLAAFVQPDLNGAVLGVLCIAGAFAAETLTLSRYLWRQARLPGPLFAAARR
jgi:hypothetical protein